MVAALRMQPTDDYYRHLRRGLPVTLQVNSVPQTAQARGVSLGRRSRSTQRLSAYRRRRGAEQSKLLGHAAST